MIIPIDELTPDTLNNIAREFVLREGTDYGEIEAAFADKVEQVIVKLKIVIIRRITKCRVAGRNIVIVLLSII